MSSPSLVFRLKLACARRCQQLQICMLNRCGTIHKGRQSDRVGGAGYSRMRTKADKGREGFYRATLCVSSVLADSCCRSVSVHLSVTLLHCIQSTKDVVKLLSWPGSPIILFFDSKHRYAIPREPLQLGLKIHGGGKILRYSTDIGAYLRNRTR